MLKTSKQEISGEVIIVLHTTFSGLTLEKKLCFGMRWKEKLYCLSICRMSCGMQCFLYLPTNRTFQMPWMQLRSLTSLVSTPFDNVTGIWMSLEPSKSSFHYKSIACILKLFIMPFIAGISRAHVPPLGKGSMRDWIGSPTILLTR